MSKTLSVKLENTIGEFRLTTSFEAAPGITALFGPSGSGKTMVLDMLAGLGTPDAGHITLNGRTLFDGQTGINLAPEKRRIGYVFQHGRLFPHLSVEANLTYGMKFVPADEQQLDFADVVEVLGIENILERRTHALSGGEAQRVAIGRALLTSPQLLLMDEPLASLDAARRLEILPFIERLRDTFDIPIVYVSHALDEVVRLGDTAVLIKDGAVMASGKADDILNRQDLRPFFGAADLAHGPAAPRTILTCKITEHDHAFELTRLTGKGLSFQVPRLDRAIGSTLRLQVNASDVSLSTEEPQNSSILNRFHGTIETLDATHAGFVDVEIAMASGASLWSRITHKSAMKLGLTTGHDVWALVKSVAVARGTAEPVPPGLET